MPFGTSTNIMRCLHYLPDRKTRTGSHSNAASSVLGAYATRNRGVIRYFRFLIDGLTAMNSNPAESNAIAMPMIVGTTPTLSTNHPIGNAASGIRP